MLLIIILAGVLVGLQIGYVSVCICVPRARGGGGGGGGGHTTTSSFSCTTVLPCRYHIRYHMEADPTLILIDWFVLGLFTTEVLLKLASFPYQVCVREMLVCGGSFPYQEHVQRHMFSASCE